MLHLSQQDAPSHMGEVVTNYDPDAAIPETASTPQ